MTKKLTNVQKAEIYCIKHGHAQFFTSFWGYKYCGRCGVVIGDSLGGIFPQATRMASPGCNQHPCEICDPIIKNLSKNDLLIFNRLKESPTMEHEKILEGIHWGFRTKRN